VPDAKLRVCTEDTAKKWKDSVRVAQMAVAASLKDKASKGAPPESINAHRDCCLLRAVFHEARNISKNSKDASAKKLRTIRRLDGPISKAGSFDPYPSLGPENDVEQDHLKTIRSGKALEAETQSPPLETACVFCGNVFMADACFCRKCGEKRPELAKKLEGAAVPTPCRSKAGRRFADIAGVIRKAARKVSWQRRLTEAFATRESEEQERLEAELEALAREHEAFEGWADGYDPTADFFNKMLEEVLTSPVGDRASACQCGNAFAADALFCRKCGEKRPLISPTGTEGSSSDLLAHIDIITQEATEQVSTFYIQRDAWKGPQLPAALQKHLAQSDQVISKDKVVKALESTPATSDKKRWRKLAILISFTNFIQNRDATANAAVSSPNSTGAPIASGQSTALQSTAASAKALFSLAQNETLDNPLERCRPSALDLKGDHHVITSSLEGDSNYDLVQKNDKENGMCCQDPCQGVKCTPKSETEPRSRRRST